jgi:hypothetical protein
MGGQPSQGTAGRTSAISAHLSDLARRKQFTGPRVGVLTS